jgi:DNA-binding CsgD family transcriptional regulator
MVDLPHAGVKIAAEVAGIASVPTSIDQRAQLLLEPLGRVVPFQGAWISLLDPEAPEQPPLVCHGYPSGLRSYMAGPAGMAEIEMLGLDRSGATRLSDLPIDLQQVRSWAEYLAPAGFRGGLAAGLFTPDGRYLGMLGLNTDSVAHPTVAARDLITKLAPMIAHAVDPMRSLTAAVTLVRHAEAGIVLTRAGNALPLPGLPTHPLLTLGSDVLRVAAQRLTQGDRHATFLCRPGDGAAAGHARVTMLACPPDVPRHLAAVVAVSPAGDLHGLTGLELVILGMLVEDWSDQRIAAALHLPLVAVTEHVEHVLAKLGVPTRLLATLRALRLGLYVPRPLNGAHT